MAETAILSSKFQLSISQLSISKAIRTAQHREAGLTFACVPQGMGVLLVPVAEKDDLNRLAKGENAADYRDRAARVWRSSSPPRRGSNG